ncbi:MAG: DUF1565 domain-containing protein [Planctomycetota bacterium]
MKYIGKFARLLMLTLMWAPAAWAADIWVAGTGTDGISGDGSFGAPYRTISWAMSNASPGDVIKVKTGDYDVNAGESFPITVKSGVDILGQEVAEIDWPRIGGDANVSSSTTAHSLFFVDATGGTHAETNISNLYFLGEDSSGKDAPSALKVLVRDGNTAVVNFEDNVCERPQMNDGGNPDRATILLDGGHGTMDVTVLNCVPLTPSKRGAIEAVVGDDTSLLESAENLVEVLGCVMELEGGDDALFGIRYAGEGEAFLDAGLIIRGNEIDSTESDSEHGIVDGIIVSLKPDGEGSMSLIHDTFELVRNRIDGCLGNGITLESLPQTLESFSHISTFDFERNIVRWCGGAALLLYSGDEYDLGEEDEVPVAGYLNIDTRSNIFSANYRGIHVVNRGDASHGEHDFLNDTIADNEDYGLFFEGDMADIRSLINCIVYFNRNGSGAQYSAGTSGWTPGGATVEYCNFQNHSSGTGNIDDDPEFVNASIGNFHLDDSSPCEDVGDNTPTFGTLSEFDIDGEDRIDPVFREIVDMGADEYQP